LYPKPNSSIFVSIFHKRVSMETELETKKKLVNFPSKRGSMRNLTVGYCPIHQDWSDISSVPIDRNNRDNTDSSLVIVKLQDFPMATDGNTHGIMMRPIFFQSYTIVVAIGCAPKTSINVAIYKTCDYSGNLI
jgi:hypothetical protein